jgi:regulatory protein
MEYMLSHGAGEEDAAAAVEYLVANGFIDNARYADAFAADKFRFAKWGAHKIAAALRRKRIQSGIIAAALDKAIDPQREKDTARDEMAKKLRGIKRDEPKQKIWQKLMRFGVARGYSVEICREAVSSLLADV